MGDPTNDPIEEAQFKMDPKQIGGQFVQHYYGLFDTDRAQLGSLYDPSVSTLTFEAAASGDNTEQRGAAEIVAKLTNLTFQTCKHDLAHARLDVQTTRDGTGIICFVTGMLSADG